MNRFEFSSPFVDLRVMTFAIEIEQEKDGRWIAEIPQIPGAMVYGRTREEAVARVEALALRVLAERIEHGEMSPVIERVFSVAVGPTRARENPVRSVGFAFSRPAGP